MLAAKGHDNMNRLKVGGVFDFKNLHILRLSYTASLTCVSMVAVVLRGNSDKTIDLFDPQLLK